MSDEQPISEFNAALANAYNAHNLRVAIQRAILIEDHNTWAKLLKCLSFEIMSWYKKSKGKRETEITKLKSYHNKLALAKREKTLYIKLLNEWTEDVMEYSYDIWFGKEKDVAGSMLQ